MPTLLNCAGEIWRALKSCKFSQQKQQSVPKLTERHKEKRLAWATAYLHSRDRLRNHNITVHIDEKWFYATTLGKNVWAHPELGVPVQKVTSRRYITKVMFLAAVARPVPGSNP